MQYNLMRVLNRWKQLFQPASLALAMFITQPANSNELKLQLPIDCKLGVDCFFQNFADLDPGPGVRDPWCGKAAYNGHKGTDIRIKSLQDIQKNVPVLASASGIIRGVRDGEPDRLVRTKEDREKIANKECGNGVVIDHGNGYVTQYCHMKDGSLQVNRGDRVRTGDTLGFVGSSGLSQFPHVHLSVRKDDEWLDIVSGQKPSDECKPFDAGDSFFDESVFIKLPKERRQLIDFGISGNVVEHALLVEKGSPTQAKRGDAATVGWAWFINLEAQDTIRFVLNGPNGLISDTTTEPLDRQKATYSGFSGKRRIIVPGTYRLDIELRNEGELILSESNELVIE